MIFLSRPFSIQSPPSLRASFLALLMATALLACTDTRTGVCLNGVRCPAGLMCVEPHGYCASPEDVEPCLGKPENVRCGYRGYDVGICRRGVCELDDCEDSVDCNDKEPCTRDACVGNRCVYEDLDGVSCDDNEFCNGTDTCVAGECAAHSGNPCTRGQTYCDADRQACAGCTESADCPESIYGEWGDCTGVAGTCSQEGNEIRTAIRFTCDSGGICRMNEGMDMRACTRNTTGVSCSDGDLCTTNDRCSDGICSGQSAPCNDGNQCTTDTCSPEQGCQHTPVPFGTPCDHGNCDGMRNCVTCDGVGQPCSTGNPCERGEIRCQSGEMTCVPVGPAPSTTVCRPAAGACDQPETCTGTDTICPDNDFLQGTTCRPAVGTCDQAETCTGTSAFCPGDTLRDPGIICRAAAGACDVPETCTGTAPVCPVDRLEASDVTCRESVGICDVAETCTGASAACPADVFVNPTTTCRASAGICDMAETCTGASATCPDDIFRDPTTTCRAAAGACDIAETCTGSSASCPADELQDPGFTCRAEAGLCDVAETCDGNSAACPVNLLLGPSVTCRPEAPGGCDVAEICTGSSAACPVDGFRNSTATCRPAAGVCDRAEACTGAGPSCPPDNFAAPGTICRADSDDCDFPEFCTGSSVSCPPDDPPPTCATNEYCYDAQCWARPTYELQGGEGDQCVDKGLAHPPPSEMPPPSEPPSSGFAVRAITRGRPGARMFGYRIHLSCGNAIRGPFELGDCYETVGSDTVIPDGGTCTQVFFNDSPLADCPDPIGGRFEQYVVVDGIESNHDFVNYYNSTLSCPADPLPDTCAAAENFCPCIGECATTPCPSPLPPGECPSAVVPLDTAVFDELDAGLTSNASSSTPEGTE